MLLSIQKKLSTLYNIPKCITFSVYMTILRLRNYLSYTVKNQVILFPGFTAIKISNTRRKQNIFFL